VPKFVKVLPQDYANVLKELKLAVQKGLTGDDAIMAAFEANVKSGH
jgi:glutamate synthase (ferredoxin)